MFEASPPAAGCMWQGGTHRTQPLTMAAHVQTGERGLPQQGGKATAGDQAQSSKGPAKPGAKPADASSNRVIKVSLHRAAAAPLLPAAFPPLPGMSPRALQLRQGIPAPAGEWSPHGHDRLPPPAQ